MGSAECGIGRSSTGRSRHAAAPARTRLRQGYGGEPETSTRSVERDALPWPRRFRRNESAGSVGGFRKRCFTPHSKNVGERTGSAFPIKGRVSDLIGNSRRGQGARAQRVEKG